MLEDRAEHRVVTGGDRPVAVLLLEAVDRGDDGLQIDQRICRVCRRLDVEQANAAAGSRRLERGLHLGGRQSTDEWMAADAPLRQDLAEQRLGAAIKWRRVHD